MNILKLEKVPKMLESASSCPGCRSRNFYNSRHGEYFCSKCSLIIVSKE